MRNGFTLVELMVVIVLISLTMSAGVAGYSRFNKRQLVITSGKELMVNLRQAQVRASSNVKSAAGCANATLSEYRIDGFSNGGSSGYTISEVYSAGCATTVTKTQVVPKGVFFSPANFQLSFKTLAGGVTAASNPYTITLCSTAACATTDTKMAISITSTGLIQEGATSN